MSTGSCSRISAAMVRVENQRHARQVGLCWDHTLKPPDLSCIEKAQTRTAWYWQRPRRPAPALARLDSGAAFAKFNVQSRRSAKYGITFKYCAQSIPAPSEPRMAPQYFGGLYGSNLSGSTLYGSTVPSLPV